MNGHRLGSFALLAGGVALVFAGLASALGYSLGGLFASAAAIAALLYAGGAWFGGASHADRSVILFTHTLVIASGPMAGRAVSDLFGDGIVDGCRRALAGEASRFSSGSRAFAASPVRSSEGAVIYGLLLSGAAAEAEAAAATPVA